MAETMGRANRQRSQSRKPQKGFVAGATFWLRRQITRLALVLGICCGLEIFFHLTEGTNPNSGMPQEYWIPFVAVLGIVSLVVSWLTYVPPRMRDDDSNSNRTPDTPHSSR